MGVPSRLPTLLAALGLASAVACSNHLPELPPSPGVPEPDPAAVETVVFLLGDAGEATSRRSPLIPAMRQDIERWATALGRDSSVAVVLLGDIVYPDGLPDSTAPRYAHDSLYVSAQADIVRGPAARRFAHAWFIAGNHDWGEEEEWEGRDRLRNLDALLHDYRDEGVPVSLEPRPGQGGPVVIDLGRRLRLLLLDTAWWILDANPIDREAFLEGLETAVAEAGDRHVVLASHHPYLSAGSHGGYGSIWSGFGIETVLKRSGAILQDLNSRPYRRLRDGIWRMGQRVGPALIHVGGHDHSLQVIRSVEPEAPRYSIVSGSGSKLTGVGHADGMLFRAAWPGYARLYILRDGRVILAMVGAEPRFLRCPDTDELDACMREGESAFRTLWSGELETSTGTPPGTAAPSETP